MDEPCSTACLSLLCHLDNCIALHHLCKLVQALGFHYDHTEIVAENDSPILPAAAFGLAESFLQAAPQSCWCCAQEIFCPCQEIHHMASSWVPLNEALSDVPTRWELINVVLDAELPQNCRDAVGGDVVAAVS